jgi:WD40 repeat protein
MSSRSTRSKRHLALAVLLPAVLLLSCNRQTPPGVGGEDVVFPATGRELLSLRTREDVCHIVFSPDGKLLATATRLGYWPRGENGGWRPRTKPSHEPRVDIVIRDATTGRVVLALPQTSGERGQDTRVDTNRAEKLGAYGGAYEVAFSPDGSRVGGVIDATPEMFMEARREGTHGLLILWDIRTGQPAFAVSGPRGQNVKYARLCPNIEVFAFSQDGQTLAAVCSDNVVRVWDARTGGALKDIPLQCERVFLPTFSGDGRRIGFLDGVFANVARTGGYVGGKIRVRDTITDEEVFSTSVDWMPSLAFSSDGETLAEIRDASWDKERKETQVRLWNISTGLEVCTFREPVVNLGLAFSPEGQRLAEVSGDPSVITIRSVVKGEELLKLTRNDGPVWSLAFSPDGQRLATLGGGPDEICEIKVWDLATGP